MHNKTNKLYQLIVSFIFACVPATVFANDAMLDAEYKIKNSVEAVKNSPIVGMVAYAGGAVVVFVGVVLVIFMLIMLLKR